MMKEYINAAEFLKSKIDIEPKFGIVLGSGLGGLVDKIDVLLKIPYNEIPSFPVATVEGHSGNLIFGTIKRVPVVAMQGRFHYYEGYEMDRIVFPIRVMKLLGIQYLFVSNAAGGLNPQYKVGDLMIISDHINFFPVNPLRGKNIDSLGVRFPDMSQVYDKQIIEKALLFTKEKKIPVHVGVYIGSSGPTLETPAEYKMFRIFGADATGMSTVPEVIIAHHMGIKVFGISVITNESADAVNEKTTHEDVQLQAALAEPRLTDIFLSLISIL